MNVAVSAPDPSGSVLVWLAATEAHWETQLESPGRAWGGMTGGWCEKKDGNVSKKTRKKQLSQSLIMGDTGYSTH